MLSERCLTDADFYHHHRHHHYFNHSIAGWTYKQSQLAEVPGVTSRWRLSWDQQSRWRSGGARHSRCRESECVSRRGWGRVEAPHPASVLWALPTHLLCWDLHTASVSFCLDWLIMKKIYLFFVTVLWRAITHVFLHTVNILWILLFKKMIFRSR